MFWLKRAARLGNLLNSQGNEEEDGLALDRLLHGQTVIGSTPRTKEVDSIRFSDSDLSVMGTLEHGQYGTIHLVTCKLDGKVYVRKSIEKKFALRTRDQCSPVLERTILLRALQSRTQWCPHLFCAFQGASHLNIVMDFAPGGSLQDLLESSPLDGCVSEADLRWWAPQIVSAIAWCHAQGFAHRDVKPNNLVLTESNHLQLIDFGSAAPLLPADDDGRRVLAREHCLVPCGTCDYISPEILVAHERALVRLEMDMSRSDDGTRSHNILDGAEDADMPQVGYGAETDWWSAGAMFYEMAYGVTPFFAESVKTTYLRIMDHETSLRFDKSVALSEPLKDLLRCLLSDASHRLGRQGVMDIMNHPFFSAVDWDHLHEQPAMADLHVPQFAALDLPASEDQSAPIEDFSGPDFAWSAMFQSSPLALAQSYGLGSMVQNTPRIKSVLRTPSALHQSQASGDVSAGLSSFIGFSWGPRKDIILVPDAHVAGRTGASHSLFDDVTATPRQLPRVAPVHTTPIAFRGTPGLSAARKQQRLVTPLRPGQQPYMTPARPMAYTPGGPTGTMGGSASTTRRRGVTEREAMRQLIDCVGMSARKAVLASGRKPRLLNAELFRAPVSGASGDSVMGGGLGKALDFARAKNRSRSVSISTVEFTENLTQSAPPARRRSGSGGGSSTRKELRFADAPALLGDGNTTAGLPEASVATSRNSLGYVDTRVLPSDTEAETETETASAPPSPSPSPRPGSAMSLNRRSMTPTATMSMFGTQSSSLRPGTALGVFDDRMARFRSVSPGLDRNDGERDGRVGGPSARAASPIVAEGEAALHVETRSSNRYSTRNVDDATMASSSRRPAPPNMSELHTAPPRRNETGSKLRQPSNGSSHHETTVNHFTQPDSPDIRELDAAPRDSRDERARQQSNGSSHAQYATTTGGSRRPMRRPTNVWDEMGERHAKLASDLESLQRRLDRIRCQL